MIKTFFETAAYVLLLICLAAGMFMLVAGVASGLGDPTVSSRATWAGLGFVSSIISIALMYLVSGRKWDKLGSDLLRLIWLS